MCMFNDKDRDVLIKENNKEILPGELLEPFEPVESVYVYIIL